MSSHPRVRTHSNPERNDGGKDDSGQEVDRELVIASGHAAEVLETTEGRFDAPAIAVALHIVPDRTFARTSPWDNRCCPGRSKGVAKAIGVIATICDQASNGTSRLDQIIGNADVTDIARREPDDRRTPQNVCQDVDFCGLTAARRTDGLRLRPPLPPWAERCALT